jgi:hypothetical protein
MGGGLAPSSAPLKKGVMGMRRTVLLLASMALAVLLASGVALALKEINCKDGGFCKGTPKRDLMKGGGRFDNIQGRGNDDVLKGFGGSDYLFGQPGDDRLIGGPNGDLLIGGAGDDALDGGDGGNDYYYFPEIDWGNDQITDPQTSAQLQLPSEDFTGTITTNLVSSDLAPEVANSANASTINWDGSVIRDVLGSGADDTITGNDDSNEIQDTPAFFGDLEDDTDNINGAGGDDEIYVDDGDGNDTVTCGGGSDTVYYDQGDVLTVPGDCEFENTP